MNRFFNNYREVAQKLTERVGFFVDAQDARSVLPHALSGVSPEEWEAAVSELLDN